MMTAEKQPESFQDFKNSFSYGSRPDMNFKFLATLSEEEAANFIQDLFWKLADSFDDGDLERVYNLVFQTQRDAYIRKLRWTYDNGSYHLLDKPLSESNIMLLTSSGHFVEGDDPRPFGIENMPQGQAAALIDDFLRTEPTLSEIPIDTPAERLNQLRNKHPLEFKGIYPFGSDGGRILTGYALLPRKTDYSQVVRQLLEVV